MYCSNSNKMEVYLLSYATQTLQAGIWLFSMALSQLIKSQLKYDWSIFDTRWSRHEATLKYFSKKHEKIIKIQWNRHETLLDDFWYLYPTIFRKYSWCLIVQLAVFDKIENQAEAEVVPSSN